MPLPLQIKVMGTNTYYNNCHAVTAIVTRLMSGSFNIPNRLHFQVSEFLDSQISRFPDISRLTLQISMFADFQIHSGNLENRSKKVWKSGNLES